MKIVTRRKRDDEELSPQVKHLLRRRAKRLQQRRETSDDEAALWIAEFPVGDEHYAIGLEQVRAAVPLRMVTPVPLAPSHVIGVLRYQGQLIPAFSLTSLLGVRGWRVDPEVLIVIESQPGKLTAIDCEQIPKATGLPIPLVEEARARSVGAIVEITTREVRQINLIDDVGLLFEQRIEGRNAG